MVGYTKLYINILLQDPLYIYIYIFTTTLIAKRKHFHFFLRRFTIHLKYKHYFMNVLKRKIFVLFPQATKVINFLKITQTNSIVFFFHIPVRIRIQTLQFELIIITFKACKKKSPRKLAWHICSWTHS